MRRIKSQFKVNVHMIGILFFAFLSQSCSTTKKVYISNQLDRNEYLQMEQWSKSNLPACSFLYSKKNLPREITEFEIMKCIEAFSLNYHQSNRNKGKLNNLPENIQDKIYFKRIDYYLGGKLAPFLSGLSASKLTTILEYIAFEYGENPIFIKLLINNGADAQNIPLQRIITSNRAASTCDASFVILNKNVRLYQNRKTLNKPVFYEMIHLKENDYEKVNLEKIYRKNVLFSTVNDVAYLHCRKPELTEALININPNLRNVIHEQTGETPLHRFLEHFGTRFSNPVDSFRLGKKLISRKNINVKNKNGQTPLRILLQRSLDQSEEYVRMVEVLIDSGANIDLKDNDGVSGRELILKHPKLKVLLKAKL